MVRFISVASITTTFLFRASIDDIDIDNGDDIDIDIDIDGIGKWMISIDDGRIIRDTSILFYT